jgi:hypothetical protein
VSRTEAELQTAVREQVDRRRLASEEDGMTQIVVQDVRPDP